MRGPLPLLLGVILAAGCASAPTLTSPTPAGSQPLTASPSATTTSSTPTPSPSRSTQTRVDLIGHAVAVPRDPKYVESWSGRILLLDLAQATATEAATYTAHASEPGYPYADISSASDGRAVMVLVHVDQKSSSLFLLTSESGRATLLLQGAIDRVLLSADGSRYAVARHDDDPAVTGLWIGSVADRVLRRLIRDDPHRVSSPPLPFAFSRDDEALAFGLGTGEAGYRAGIIGGTAAETDAAHLLDPKASSPGITLLDPAAGAEFISTHELFLWSSASAFGGQTAVYLYDTDGAKRTELYRPTPGAGLEATWRPTAEEFVTIEHPLCCGVGLLRTVWLRGRDGAATKLAANAFLGATWWSRDGSRLYASVGGDDSTGVIVDLLSGAAVMSFCKRGGSPGSCT